MKRIIEVFQNGSVVAQEEYVITSEQAKRLVDQERDRRLSVFVFDGVTYDFDAVSRSRIDKAKTNAMAAMELGAEAGNLRWADAEMEFGWIARDNTFVPMDAPTCLAFGLAAAAWEAKLILACRAIKNRNPIPADFDHDSYWPAP